MSLVRSRAVVALALIALFGPNVWQPAEAVALAGKPCKKVGAFATNNGHTHQCVRSGSKLVWRVLNAAPAPKISRTPSPSASPFLVSKESDPADFLPTNYCQLRDASLPNVYGALTSGFPNPSSLHNKSIIRSLALFVDYPDLIGGYDPSAGTNIATQQISDFYSTISYGRIKFEWTLTNSFSRMPHEVGYYHLTRATFQAINPRDNENFLQDAISAADPLVDYSKYDLVIIFGPKQATMDQIGEHPGTRSGTNIKIYSDEGQVRNIQTSIANGARWSNWGLGSQASGGVIHEIGHELGLVDLYLYPNTEPVRYGTANVYSDLGSFGTFDYMNALGGKAPEPNGWNRWLMGILRADEVSCLDRAHTGIVKLGALEGAPPAYPGRRLVVIRKSDTQAVLIESRRRMGYDADLNQKLTGLLVYRLDTAWATGHGAFGIVPRIGSTSPDLEDAMLRQGDSLVVDGFKISNIRSDIKGDLVSISFVGTTS